MTTVRLSSTVMRVCVSDCEVWIGLEEIATAKKFVIRSKRTQRETRIEMKWRRRRRGKTHTSVRLFVPPRPNSIDDRTLLSKTVLFLKRKRVIMLRTHTNAPPPSPRWTRIRAISHTSHFQDRFMYSHYTTQNTRARMNKKKTILPGSLFYFAFSVSFFGFARAAVDSWINCSKPIKRITRVFQFVREIAIYILSRLGSSFHFAHTHTHETFKCCARRRFICG